MTRTALTLLALFTLAACAQTDGEFIDTGEEDDRAAPGELLPPDEFGCQPDAYEPNDFSDEAKTGFGPDDDWGFHLDVMLCADDVDWFDIGRSGAAEGELTVVWDAANGDVSVEVFNAGGDLHDVGWETSEGVVYVALWGAAANNGVVKVEREDADTAGLAYSLNVSLYEGGGDE